MSDYIFLKGNHGKLSLDKWVQVIENDPSLSLDQDRVAMNPLTHEKMVVSLPGHAIYSYNGEKVEIFYKDGVLCATNDVLVISKFKDLAVALDASIHDNLG